MSTPLRLGLDIGSTTLKLVLLDGLEIRFETYRRHNADITGELNRLLGEVAEIVPGTDVVGAVTGSGGLSVAHALGLPFVQEVIAETAAIKRFDPDTDVIIELGGEDAKITYLHPVPEQRMNGTCAGGTGAFIDQMASLLKTDAAGLNELASRYTTLYPIASRCGVFAKSDLQPLINDGVAHEDLAASVFTAVVQQTIAGLACGRPIRGNVVFLGGPLYFLPELRNAFERQLAGTVTSFSTPDRAQLYVAIGAALLAETSKVAGSGRLQKPATLETLRDRSTNATRAAETHRMRPLFANEDEYREFQERHERANVSQVPISEARGACFLGIDAGSTTLKATLIDDAERIVYSWYGPNEGSPVERALEVLAEIRENLPSDAMIARTCVTGYGESLIQAALKAEDGEVETMAHYRAAQYLEPEVSSIIDIGGQDMKYLRIRDGAIDSISVNEACSSGCGSFLQTFAATMDTDIRSFAKAALSAPGPVDLGSRCTVFMNSSVKQAQKEGADPGEISAGLSYSVVRNALYKVIKLKNPEQLGPKVVVQGGTFLNDAVLRAFELLTEREVVRPDIAGLMGAFGASRIARERWHKALSDVEKSMEIDTTILRPLESERPGSPAAARAEAEPAAPAVALGMPSVRRSQSPTSSSPTPTTATTKRAAKVTVAGAVESSLLSLEEINRFSIETTKDICRLCQNHCQRTISTFADGSRHVSGNRCDRGAEVDNRKLGKKAKSELPNIFEEKYKRLFAYRRLTESAAHRGDIGIPRALNMYENYPFWFTMLTKLGFRVMISGRSSHETFELGMDSIPSENVCYPAKLAHGHVQQLLDKGIKTIFYPCISYEQKMFAGSDNNYNCPVVMSYPEVINANVEGLQEHGVKFMLPFFNLADPETLVRRVTEEFAEWDVTEEEASEAIEAAYAEDAAVKQDIREMGRSALRYMEENNVPGIVLAGRPYHLDPEVHHGIPELVNSLGMAVLTEDCIVEPGTVERPLNVFDQWMYHTRLYEAAAIVAKKRRDLELVQLNSFGCGVDAITGDQVANILEAAGRVYTTLKIDEVSNLGAARIRLRSLKAATRARADKPIVERPELKVPRHEFTKEMAEDGWTILMPQMAPFQMTPIEAAAQSLGYNMKLLPTVSKDDIELGLKYVNNDACYPALVVIGQLIGGLKSGEYDPDRTAVIITQTGGVCRATNYAAMLRKGLKEAGHENVPVVTLSAGSLEKHSGFKITATMLHRLGKAVVIGDLLQNVTMRTRPYEKQKGSANELHHYWDQVTRDYFLHDGYSPTLGHRITYQELCNKIVRAFDALELTGEPRRPRVGIVGEILVKFHPDANNHAVDVVEREGCEAVIPGLMGFLMQSLASADWRYETLGVGKESRRVKKLGLWALERYEAPATRALKRANGKFDIPTPMHQLVEKAQQLVQLGNSAGEGWYLTGEMMDLIESGTPNIICAQPFACLPNHITGKGMFGALRRRYPEANVVGIDYDPGASEVNQLNRIKLMISTAMDRRAEQDAAAVASGKLPFDESVLPDIRYEMAERVMAEQAAGK
ncbi:MAG TPA: acyl-CoA dehydratase activase-related protein [Actinomycetaceae bacterium]|nr:acyl-CoA dehydratase activase-related protein [Actinomycetaceae bacterium]